MPLYRRAAGVNIKTRLRLHGFAGAFGPKPAGATVPVGSGDTVYASEPLGAGGWVTGITISPDGLTRLARTDTLGAWRWDQAGDQWVAAITATSMADDSNRLDSGVGVNAIAAANDRAFIAYRNRVYRSLDGGSSWAKVLDGPVTAPNTGDQRWWNTRMAFDPNDSQVLIYGTLNAGLHFTLDGGTTWSSVSTSLLPAGLDGAATPGKPTFGIVCVAIAGDGTWYAAPFGYGIYRSTNHGSSWTKITSDTQFVAVSGLAVGPNGDLMITGHTSTATPSSPSTSVVYRYHAGSWNQITGLVGQGSRKWRSVAYDPSTPGRVIVQGDGGYNRVSADYGATWSSASHSMESVGDVPWLAAANGFGADFYFITLGGLTFDPVVPGRLWMSQGIGVWYADMPAGPSDLIPWHAQSRGIEQLVVNDVLCPPSGPPVVVSWDRAIFLAGETTSLAVVNIATPQPVPVGSGGSILATLVRGWPMPITYAWSVVAKPGSSSGGTLTAPTSLSTGFVPDVVGSYTLRLTATNATGVSTTDVAVTATAKVTNLILPTGNYLSTPDDPSLNIAGDLTLLVKLSMGDWAPATRTTIIGKHATSSRSYRLAVDALGVNISLETAASGATGFHGSTNIPLTFPPGSVHWIRLVYNATAQTVAIHTSEDGVTWSLHKQLATNFSGTLGPLATSTAPLTVGWSGSASTAYLGGHVYKAQVYAGASLVADFDAEAVTRTGTRSPASVTEVVGRVWTPQGTGWDWAA